jgi:hypothetical protein
MPHWSSVIDLPQLSRAVLKHLLERSWKLAKLGERPAMCNDTRNPALAYRINKILAKCHGFISPGGMTYHALDSKTSLEEIRQSGKSFIRFGDAEAKLMLGGDWPTQLGSKDLAAGLYSIFENYTQQSRYWIGVANSRLTQDLSELKKRKIHRTWRNARYVLRNFLRKDNPLKYLEANLFRIGTDGLQVKEIDRLWAEKSQIILVHNHEKYLHWFRAAYPSIRAFFVQIPEKNFFQELAPTQHKIMRLIQSQGLKRTEFAILISAGAGGKVLNYNLCQKDADCLCYDMGNFFHMQLNQAAVRAELIKRRQKYEDPSDPLASPKGDG